MPVLLFKLNGVPEDEADEVRALLDNNNISYYETSAGNWRISLAAIWLNNESSYDRAIQIIEEYQARRQENARQVDNQAELGNGKLNFITRIRSDPVRYLLYLLAVLVVLYFSTVPFFYFPDWLGHGGN